MCAGHLLEVLEADLVQILEDPECWRSHLHVLRAVLRLSEYNSQAAPSCSGQPSSDGQAHDNSAGCAALPSRLGRILPTALCT